MLRRTLQTNCRKTTGLVADLIEKFRLAPCRQEAHENGTFEIQETLSVRLIRSGIWLYFFITVVGHSATSWRFRISPCILCKAAILSHTLGRILIFR